MILDGKMESIIITMHIMLHAQYVHGYIFINAHYILLLALLKKGLQCKAGRERLAHFRYEGPSPTTPTHRMEEEKGKTVGDKKGCKQLSPIKRHWSSS